MSRPDPIEALIADALSAAGVAFERGDHRHPHLDFHLPALHLWIEVKQFHSARVADQMARVDNVIVVQGRAAAEALARLIRAGGWTPV